MRVYKKNNCTLMDKHKVDQWSRLYTHSKEKKIHTIFQSVISDYKFFWNSSIRFFISPTCYDIL